MLCTILSNLFLLDNMAHNAFDLLRLRGFQVGLVVIVFLIWLKYLLLYWREINFFWLELQLDELLLLHLYFILQNLFTFLAQSSITTSMHTNSSHCSFLNTLCNQRKLVLIANPKDMIWSSYLNIVPLHKIFDYQKVQHGRMLYCLIEFHGTCLFSFFFLPCMVL
jgi:hypothetical protein